MNKRQKKKKAASNRRDEHPPDAERDALNRDAVPAAEETAPPEAERMQTPEQTEEALEFAGAAEALEAPESDEESPEPDASETMDAAEEEKEPAPEAGAVAEEAAPEPVIDAAEEEQEPAPEAGALAEEAMPEPVTDAAEEEQESAPEAGAVAEEAMPEPVTDAAEEEQESAPEAGAVAEEAMPEPVMDAAEEEKEPAPEADEAAVDVQETDTGAAEEEPKTAAPGKFAQSRKPETAATKKVLKILHVASEALPFVKTGGLADVLGSLPKTQAAMGHDVSVVLPKYRDIPWKYVEQMTYVTNFTVQLGWRTQYCGVLKLVHAGVTFYFIDNEFYFGFPGVYTQGSFEAERFCFFSRAVLEMVGHLALYPDILHCHDWQSGMVPFLLKTQYAFNPAYLRATSVYTIHNLKFQGVFSWPQVEGMLFIDYRYNNPRHLEFNGDANFMKAGVVFSDIVTTVSPTYAREIQTEFYGEKLDGLLRDRANDLFGVLNGLDTDEYDPGKDPFIPAHFSPEDLSGKAVCKAALQREIWLAGRAEAPLIGVVSRLTAQKGFDLVQRVLCDLLDTRDVQLALLGTGEQSYEEFFRWASGAYPGRVAARIEMNGPLSHRIYAGCDFFLMPSLFEPCGLSQMMAMRYGTLPIVRETGGLADTVSAYNQYEGTGTGFSFYNYNAHEMLGTIENALNVYKLRRDHCTAMMKEAMRRDFSWGASAARYVELYRMAAARKG